MTKRIDSPESYELGKMAGKKESLIKIIEMHFDYMKRYYINKMDDIYDEKIIEELFDNPSFFTNQRSRDNLEIIMNAIRIASEDYERLKKEQEKEKPLNE